MPKTYCGPASTEGKRVSARMARGFTDEMDAYGAQYAVTLKGRNVSVLAFSEMGPGVPAPNFDKLARRAAAKLTR